MQWDKSTKWLAWLHNSHVRSYAGVTDGEWYRYLAARLGLREVNFWPPSGGGRFGALSVGEPFFFKIDCHIGRPGRRDAHDRALTIWDVLAEGGDPSLTGWVRR